MLLTTVGVLCLSACSDDRHEPAADGPQPQSATVAAVVDGDTIDVDTAAGSFRVRLIGIDTPEINRDGGQEDCYALEARGMLDDLLYGKIVQLVADPTQANVDAYGRLLRYVLVDGVSAAETLIRDGGGREYTYDAAYAHQQAHLDAQQSAADEGLGLWSACP